MSETKMIKLGEVHNDMERYLRDDCYCQGEIYDSSGFFYIVLTVDDTCYKIESNDDMTAVVAMTSNGNEMKNPQAIIFWHVKGGGRIFDARIFDATENNIGILKSIVLREEPDGRKIDEFVPGQTAKNLEKILSIADMVMVS